MYGEGSINEGTDTDGVDWPSLRCRSHRPTRTDRKKAGSSVTKARGLGLPKQEQPSSKTHEVQMADRGMEVEVSNETWTKLFGVEADT